MSRKGLQVYSNSQLSDLDRPSKKKSIPSDENFDYRSPKLKSRLKDDGSCARCRKGSSVETAVQTDEELLELDQLCQDEPSENYWKMLAEQRRLALVETLEENEELYSKLDAVEQELAELRIIAEQARKYAEIVSQGFAK